MKARVLAIFIAVNAIVLWNAIAHDARVGYDAEGHLAYIEALSRGHLPTRQETAEYFSPPLSYAVPALVHAAGLPLAGAAKVAQLLNVLYSLVLTWSLLKLGDLVRPGDASLKALALGVLGMLPVYYKSFAMVRPEPLLACVAVLTMWAAVRVMGGSADRLRGVVTLGVVMGLLLLTRQGGFLLIGAMALFSGVVMLQQPSRRRSVGKALVGSLVIAALVGGWFYVHLTLRYGSPMAFNAVRHPTCSLANRPRSFYTSLSLRRIVEDPIRPLVPPEQFVPIFYSEVWGDFEGYFSVYAKDRRTGRYLRGFDMEDALARSSSVPAWMETNRFTINRYLGRVNVVSLLPSVVLLFGLSAGIVGLWRVMRRPSVSEREMVVAWLTLGVLCTAAGYAWFLMMHSLPRSPASLIKATYVLQAFPLLALLAAEWLQRLRECAPGVYRLLLIGLALVALHNLPACLTRHPQRFF